MLSNSSNSRNILTVSKLNRLARSVLESEIGQVWLTGEISNFVAASSGHWYFTLKDSKAQVRAAMFRGANTRVVSRPKEGDKVLVRANVGLYEPRGDYQLVVDFLEPEGEGRLKQEFEKLKIKLAAEGLFSQQAKKPLPKAITRVGVVTSSTGAALHDILTVLARRNPAIRVILYPTLVQGEQAAESIIRAVASAQRRNEVDVLIVGRGGGSLEDLWCFNNEKLARVLFASEIPVISAVGHEIDVTIADFVADLRAPTPSAAAEMVSADSLEVLHNIAAFQQRLIKSFNSITRAYQHRIEIANHRLRQTHPENQIQQQYQRLDRLTLALGHGTNGVVKSKMASHQNLAYRLAGLSPLNAIKRQQTKVESLRGRFEKAMQVLLKNHHFRLAKSSQLLDTVSPLATLSRGYSISFLNHKIVTDADQLKPGDILETRLSKGVIKSEVIPLKS